MFFIFKENIYIQFIVSDLIHKSHFWYLPSPPLVLEIKHALKSDSETTVCILSEENYKNNRQTPPNCMKYI